MDEPLCENQLCGRLESYPMMNYTIPENTLLWRWDSTGTFMPGTVGVVREDSRWAIIRTTKRVTYTPKDEYPHPPEQIDCYYFRLPEDAFPYTLIAVEKEVVLLHPEFP